MADIVLDDLDGVAEVPRKNGELVFAAPWEGRAFGMAVALADGEGERWEAFRQRLIAEIAATEESGEAGEAFAYYERWLAAFETFVLDAGFVTAEELDARTGEYAAGLRDDDDGHQYSHVSFLAEIAAFPEACPAPAKRTVVRRADGYSINVVRHVGQLFVCATGCCCGHTERGHDPVPTEVYHNEWERRRLRNKIHLSMGGCLGPCALSNVVLLLFAGQDIWFHSVKGAAQVQAIYDYVEAMLAAGECLPPPPALAAQVFTVFDK
ncbi:MAG: nitrile hydratase accessory protein [Thermomicrobiales bacterium]